MFIQKRHIGVALRQLSAQKKLQARSTNVALLFSVLQSIVSVLINVMVIYGLVLDFLGKARVIAKRFQIRSVCVVQFESYKSNVVALLTSWLLILFCL